MSELGIVIGGIPIGIGSTIHVFLSDLTSWVVDGASALIVALGQVITTSTVPTLDGGFSIEFAVVVKIGAALVAPFLAVAIISAIVHQDAGIILKAVFVRLPLALLFSGVAVELVTLSLQATDELSSALVSIAGGSLTTILTGVANALVQITVGPGGLGGFAAVLLAGLAAMIAFSLWLELVIRSAAIVVATLFLPIVLAGVVWPTTAHWARRLGETIGALILSKLVITGVLVLAATTLAHADGPSAAVDGIAALLLATLAPFSLLRLIPAIEAGAVAHFEGMSRHGMRAGQTAMNAGMGLVDDIRQPALFDPQQSGGPVGYADGTPDDPAEMARLTTVVSQEIAAQDQKNAAAAAKRSGTTGTQTNGSDSNGF